jgi:hypothetical protein
MNMIPNASMHENVQKIVAGKDCLKHLGPIESFSVFDTSGRCYRAEFAENGTVDFSHLLCGYYLVVVNQKGGKVKALLMEKKE